MLELRRLMAGLALAAALPATGCFNLNPFNREPANVFYGTIEYGRRAETLALSGEQAFRLASAKAQADQRQRGEQRTQYIGRNPVMLHGRIYVFSLETPEGANLKGYHVDGDTGLTQFYLNDEFIKRPRK